MLIVDKRLKAGSKSEKVADTIRAKILHDTLPGGAELGEIALGIEYGVARPTVKAALQILIQEELVTKVGNHTAQVATFTPDDMLELAWLISIWYPSAYRDAERYLLLPSLAAQLKAAQEVEDDQSLVEVVRILYREMRQS
jgi:DNA-binding GntR family transcriptional regulator